MISMRSFFTHNAFYLLSVILLTIITVQIVITPQLGADDDLPVPMPIVDALACVGYASGHIYVSSTLVNADYILHKYVGWVFSGKFVGYVNDKRVRSEEWEHENGQSVKKVVNYKSMFIEIVEGANTESTTVHGEISGETGSVGVSDEEGSSTNTPKVRNEANYYASDTFSPRSHADAFSSGYLSGKGYGDHDCSGAEYRSYMIIGFKVCDNVS